MKDSFDLYSGLFLHNNFSKQEVMADCLCSENDFINWKLFHFMTSQATEGWLLVHHVAWKPRTRFQEDQAEASR